MKQIILAFLHGISIVVFLVTLVLACITDTKYNECLSVINIISLIVAVVSTGVMMWTDENKQKKE